ncbi:hypothetical protein Kim5_PB00412 (plasmid) [Rhizobium sp. Kim5]|nr:hypothetical protein Kim5_PB00412 [Rhizobium sp. Kim5]
MFVPDTFQDACQLGEKNTSGLIFCFNALFLNNKFFEAFTHNQELRKSMPRLYYRKLYSFIILDKS